MRMNVIAAACGQAPDRLGIGVGNALPWHLPNEFKHFVRLTTTTCDANKINAVVMGV
jgi:dihydrofolate reductase